MAQAIKNSLLVIIMLISMIVSLVVMLNREKNVTSHELLVDSHYNLSIVGTYVQSPFLDSYRVCWISRGRFQTCPYPAISMTFYFVIRRGAIPAPVLGLHIPFGQGDPTTNLAINKASRPWNHFGREYPAHTFSGLSGSINHWGGLYTIYSRIRFKSSSLRIMCS